MNLPLPDDVGMAPAHYGVHVEARRSDNTGYTLLCLGPYTQIRLASRDADRLNTELEDGRAATVLPGFAVTAKVSPFHVSDHASYRDPYECDVTALLADSIEAPRSTCPGPARAARLLFRWQPCDSPPRGGAAGIPSLDDTAALATRAP